MSLTLCAGDWKIAGPLGRADDLCRLRSYGDWGALWYPYTEWREPTRLGHSVTSGQRRSLREGEITAPITEAHAAEETLALPTSLPRRI
jgi:hypothetical protein